MKCLSAINIPALVLSLLFCYTKAQGQDVSDDLLAMNNGGKMAIKVKDLLILNTYFAIEGNQVSLDLYFNPDDPMNGNYFADISSSGTTTETFYYLTFGDIQYQEGLLTFGATDILEGGTIREYVFIQGNYIKNSGGPIAVCPTTISCSGTGIYLYFNPSEYTVSSSSLTENIISIFAPGLIENGVQINNQYSISQNYIRIKSSESWYHCYPAFYGPVIITINGISCAYQGGALISSPNCSPWGDYYGDNPECGAYLENCAPAIIELLSEEKQALPCRQWTSNGNVCGSYPTIHRTGKLAIGTDQFSASQLTVKNGIITDALKITNTGWGDYVFEENYPLMTLEQVEAYIHQYHHLPGTPSGVEVHAEGSFELGAVAVDHQVKIEEIFLHLINLEKETKLLEGQLSYLEVLNNIRVR